MTKFKLKPEKHPNHDDEMALFISMNYKACLNDAQRFNLWNRYWQERVEEIELKKMNKQIDDIKQKYSSSSAHLKEVTSNFQIRDFWNNKEMEELEDPSLDSSIAMSEELPSEATVVPSSAKFFPEKVSVLLSPVLHVKNKFGPLGVLLPFIHAKFVNAEDNGRNPLDCIDEKLAYTLKVINHKLKAISEDPFAKQIERIVALECYSSVSKILEQVFINSSLGMEMLAIKTFGMEKTQILTCVVEEMNKVATVADVERVLEVLGKNHARMMALKNGI